MHQNESGRQEASAKPVIAAASKAFRVNHRPPVATGLNLFLVCVALSGTLFQLFGMPFVLRDFGARAAWLLLPVMLLQPLHWGLIHEAIHFHLFPNRRANEFCARILSIALGMPFDATRFGHLVHHRYARHGHDRPDVYDGRSPYLFAWLAYRARLFGGVYLASLVTPLIACAPPSLGARLMEHLIAGNDDVDTKVRRLFVSVVTNDAKRRRTRHDFAFTLALYGTSAWLYGAWWPMLLIAVYVRGVWHSFADNLAHHGVSLDEPESARNFALPLIFRTLVMNHHLHLTHHLYPALPWTSLVGVNGPKGQLPDDNYFRAAFRQTNRSYPRALDAMRGA
jgi:fatty acid desaturase